MLKAHRSVELIWGDRAGAVGRGVREAAPKARQVADRLDLLRSCSDTLLHPIERQFRLVRDVGRTLALNSLLLLTAEARQ